VLRKIRDVKPYWNQPAFCQHPEHNFPSMIVLDPGVWEHECPGCGKKVHVFVPLVTMSTGIAAQTSTTAAEVPVTPTSGSFDHPRWSCGE
jgi:hypothetical protein